MTAVSAKKFWLAVAVQLLVLFGMIGVHSYTVATGTPVLLKTAPVDPWDALRGQYVSLNYEISMLRPEQIPMTGLPYRSGQTIWVTLQKGNPYWTAVAVSDKRSAAAAGQVIIKGIVQWYMEPFEPKVAEPTSPPGAPPPPETPPPQPARLMVRYGIEQFYVPEGQGEDLQRQVRDMSVEALVDSTGRAALHKVFLGDKEIKWN